jgi:hypothetical protein
MSSRNAGTRVSWKNGGDDVKRENIICPFGTKVALPIMYGSKSLFLIEDCLPGCQWVASSEGAGLRHSST